MKICTLATTYRAGSDTFCRFNPPAGGCVRTAKNWSPCPPSISKWTYTRRYSAGVGNSWHFTSSPSARPHRTRQPFILPETHLTRNSLRVEKLHTPWRQNRRYNMVSKSFQKAVPLMSSSTRQEWPQSLQDHLVSHPLETTPLTRQRMHV